MGKWAGVLIIVVSCGEPHTIIDESKLDANGSGGGGGGCSNTQTDARNCGACGHDCGDATCSAGLCTPTVLAAVGVGGVAATEPLFADGTAVIFGSTGSVCNVGGSCETLRRCNGAGCGMSPVVLSGKGPGTGQPFVADAGTAYWFYSNLGLVSCDLQGGCATNPTVVWSASTGFGASLAIDATNVYWTHIAQRTIYACARTGCSAPTPIATVPGSQALRTALLADGGSVFFVSDTTVFSVPADASSAPTVVVSGLGGISGLDADASNIYWAGFGGDIGTCPKTGCAVPKTLKQLSLQAANVIVDGNHVYWSQRTKPSEIGRCTLPDCTEQLVLVKGPMSSMPGIAVDATNLYFGNGSLNRVAK